MAIQTVFVGTTPGDDTGDPARTAFIKINDNFTQPENAASRLVGTAADRVPLNSMLGTAASRDVATTAQALAGTPDVLPDAAGVKAHVDNSIAAVTSTLGTAATKDVGTADGNLMQVGAFGLGLPKNLQGPSNNFATHLTNNPQDRVSYNYNTTSRPSLIASGTTYPSIGGVHLVISNQEIPHKMALISVAGNAVTGQSIFLHTGNTTVDGNGFIKAASPIVNLYRDRAESNGSAELEEMQFERIDTGHYRLTGVPELSRDGWYIETPKDRNGNVYFTLDYVESENTLEILTFEPDYSTGRAENGAPVDIIDGRFVSLRFAASPETDLPEES